MRPDNMNLRELQKLLYQRITDLGRTKESLGEERRLARARSRRWYSATSD